MKFVIISHNSYPALGPRSFRTTELAKELKRIGHDVTLYALLGAYDYSAVSNETGIIFKNLGKSRFGIQDNIGYKKSNLVYRIFRKLLGRFFEFPMVELIPMVKKALHDEGEIDFLITIAFPHTIHWGTGQYVKRNRKKIKFWIADCGDPYCGNPFIKPPFYFKIIERKWCKIVNYISIPIESAKSAYLHDFRDKIRVIPQGFNFNNLKLSDYKRNQIPTFAFSGIVYKKLRDPSAFMEFLLTLNLEYKFIVYTETVNEFSKYSNELQNRLEIRQYVPREELLYNLSKMDFLINIKNNSDVQLPSKLIDYALTNRPILNISSEFNLEEKNNLMRFLNGDYSTKFNIEDIQKFNIENVVQEFIKLYKTDDK